MSWAVTEFSFAVKLNGNQECCCWNPSNLDDDVFILDSASLCDCRDQHRNDIVCYKSDTEELDVGVVALMNAGVCDCDEELKNDHFQC